MAHMADIGSPSIAVAQQMAPRQSPRLLQYLALLPVAAAELDDLVEREIERNPLLERSANRRCVTCGSPTSSGICHACAVSLAREPSATQNWRDDLLALARLELPAGLHAALAAVVGSLDDRGFVTRVPDMPPTDLQLVLTALRIVGPPGIAASSALDCVRLQVDALITAGTAPPLLGQLLEGWLTEIADQRYDEIAGTLGVDVAEVASAVRILQTRTRPYVALDEPSPRLRPADVVFTQAATDAALGVEVHDAEWLGLRIADDLKAGDRGSRDWIRPLRRSAAQLIAAVNARATMLGRVAGSLAAHQGDFIRHGDAHHRDLRRATLAEELAVHPSTIGRAVSGKVARCPDGRTVPLEDFFGHGPSLQRAVAQVVRDLPGATDAQLAEELGRRGLFIARRTVAKYRRLLST